MSLCGSLRGASTYVLQTWEYQSLPLVRAFGGRRGANTDAIRG